jgi:anthranilate/para-aminobenzoate synthase component I
MTDLADVLTKIPDLPRPLVLLEGGEGGEGVVRLCWGASSRYTLEWDRKQVGEAEWLNGLPSDDHLVGFVSYDLEIPPGARRNVPMLEQPLADFFQPEYELVFDSGTGVVLEDLNGAVAVLEALGGSAENGQENLSNPDSSRLQATSFTQSEFENAVQRVKEYIASGDVYQANLSVSRVFETTCTPWDTYLRLREINPSPWMGFADFGDWQVVSGSPELLVEVGEGDEGRVVRTRPIAGTRKKTGDPDKDSKMRAELSLDEKEQAEHMMLVDLARNDVGRIAEYGSLEVAELAVVEEYSHVFHLVSEVRARLRPGTSNADVLHAMFPCGTITGVPKIRAMEVIAELEPAARGGYTGALGWMGPAGMQFNILIRSAIFRGDRVGVQAGAGIVWDSIPDREWHESLRKAEATLVALGLGE